MSVVFPESFPPSRPYLCPRFSLRRVLCRSTLEPYARVNLQSQSCSASSSSSSSSTSSKYIFASVLNAAFAFTSSTPYVLSSSAQSSSSSTLQFTREAVMVAR